MGSYMEAPRLGGSHNDGTIFRIDLGVKPFAKTLPGAGKVEAPVVILGTNLTGATHVTFNGVAANFIVKSPSEIITSVPAGATTGTVEVVTPRGTLLTNVVFEVLH